MLVFVDPFLTVCVETTVAGTCLTVAVPKVMGVPETAEATASPLAPVTTLAAIVTTVAHEEAAGGLLPEEGAIVMV